MNTLLLDRKLWDLVVDSSGNIALASEPYQIAQDVASACRTFRGECWFNTTIGVPYFKQVLGHFPPLRLVKSLLAQAAATVPGCGSPRVFITDFKNRHMVGQVRFIDSNAKVQVAAIATPTGQFVLGESILGGPDVV